MKSLWQRYFGFACKYIIAFRLRVCLMLPFLTLQCAAGVGDWSWTWLDPKPTGATLYDVACNESNCVVVGEKGIILNSSNGGVDWTTAYSPALTDFEGVIPWQGGFLAWGSGNIFLRIQSPSTISTNQLVGQALQVNEMAVVSNTLVAAAFDSLNQRTLLLISTNAQVWTTNFIFNNFSVSVLATNNGVTLVSGTVVSSGQSYILRSTNFVNWDTIAFNPGNTLQNPSTRLRSAGNYFFDFPFLGDYFYRSTNGLDWTSNSLPSNFVNTQFADVVEDHGTYHFVGSYYSANLYYSILLTSDFTNFTSTGITDGTGSLASANKSSGRLIAVGYGGLIYTAPLGSTNWTSLQPFEWVGSRNGGLGRFYRMATISNLALLLDGNNCLYSSNGIQWFTNTLPATFYAICAGNGRVIARDDQWPVNAWVTTNGFDWKLSTRLGYIYSEGFVFGNGLFVANQDVSDPIAPFLTSSNGINWTSISNSLQIPVLVGVANSKWFGVTSNYTTLCTSQDFTHWTMTGLVFPVGSVKQVFWWKNKYIILGGYGAGAVYVSTNLTTATQYFAASLDHYVRQLFSIGDTLFVTESDGSVWYSMDGMNWLLSDIYLPTDGYVFQFGNRLIVSSDNGIAESASFNAGIRLRTIAKSSYSLDIWGVPGSGFNVSQSSNLLTWTGLSNSTFIGFQPIQIGTVQTTNAATFFKINSLP
jgi:hypothetical protein